MTLPTPSTPTPKPNVSTQFWQLGVAVLGVVVAVAIAAATPVSPAAQAQRGNYDDLQRLFAEWREFQKPKVVNGVPDYTAAAMAAQHRDLARYQQRLGAIDPSAWPIPQQVDYQVVRAEMNGLDFDHRVLRPWARDPSYYVVVHTSQSDTPAHEGSAVFDAIELWTYEFPVRAERLTELRTK